MENILYKLVNILKNLTMFLAEQFDRFVDRDMMVRYHCGLGIGHTYSHSHHQPSDQEPRSSTAGRSEGQDPDSNSEIILNDINMEIVLPSDDEAQSESDSSGDDYDGWEDGEAEASEDPSDDDGDDELLAMDEMYGSIN